jgi:hypothetical protein
VPNSPNDWTVNDSSHSKHLSIALSEMNYLVVASNHGHCHLPLICCGLKLLNPFIYPLVI